MDDDIDDKLLSRHLNNFLPRLRDILDAGTLLAEYLERV